MIVMRPSTLRREGERLGALRAVRAPFAALGALLMLINLFLPTALAAMPAGAVDALGSPICSGLDTSGEGPALVVHCNACCPAAGAVAPSPPIAAIPVRFAEWRAPLRASSTRPAPTPMAVRPAPRGPPAV